MRFCGNIVNKKCQFVKQKDKLAFLCELAQGLSYEGANAETKAEADKQKTNKNK